MRRAARVFFGAVAVMAVVPGLGCEDEEQPGFFNACETDGERPARCGPRPDAAAPDAALRADAAPALDAAPRPDASPGPDTGPSGDAGLPSDAAAPPPDAAPLGLIGAACESEVECASNFCLTSEFARALAPGADDVEIPGGYCAALNCFDNPSCGEGGRCIDLRASGLDVPFKACLQECAAATADTCRPDHVCHCDPDDVITDVDGANGVCLCLPPLLVELLTGG